MNDPIDEVELERVSQITASACRTSRLDKSLTEKSRDSHPRKSRSDTDQRSRSRGGAESRNRSRSSTRVSFEEGERLTTDANNLSAGVPTSDPRTDDLTLGLRNLAISGENDSSPVVRPKAVMNPPLERSVRVEESRNTDSNSNKRTVDEAALSPPPSRRLNAEAIPDLRRSMQPFLPPSPQEVVEGACGDRDLARNAETIYEDRPWPRQDSPESDISQSSGQIILGLKQQEELHAQLASENDELRREIAFERRERQKDADEWQGMVLDRENELAEVKAENEQLRSERAQNRRSTEMLSMKIQEAAEANRRVEQLERGLMESEEEVVALRKEYEMETTARKEERKLLREEMDIVLQTLKDRETECEKLKRRFSTFKRNSTSVLGGMKRTSSTLSLRPSEASTGGINPVHDVLGELSDAADAETGAVARPSLSEGEMYKVLTSAKWPAKSVFFSFHEYLEALKTHADTLYDQGVDTQKIAISLNSDLMNGPIGSNYAAHSRLMKSITIKGVFDAIRACDKASKLLTNIEKFNLIKREGSEDLFSLMRRLSSAYVDYNIGDVTDEKTMLRVVKNRFCDAASLPQIVRDNLRHCTSLDDTVIFANEDLTKIAKETQMQQHSQGIFPSASGHQQQRPFFQNKGKGSFKGNFQPKHFNQNWRQPQPSSGYMPQQQSWQPQPLQQQGPLPLMQQQVQPLAHIQPQQHNFGRQSQHWQQLQQPQQSQQPQHVQQQQHNILSLPQQNHGHINSINLSVPPPTAQPGLPPTAPPVGPASALAAPAAARAPTGFEHNPSNKEILVCLRCRVLRDHSHFQCKNRKFCSECQREGHTNFEHRDVLDGMNGGRASSAPGRQQNK